MLDSKGVIRVSYTIENSCLKRLHFTYIILFLLINEHNNELDSKSSAMQCEQKNNGAKIDIFVNPGETETIEAMDFVRRFKKEQKVPESYKFAKLRVGLEGEREKNMEVAYCKLARQDTPHYKHT